MADRGLFDYRSFVGNLSAGSDTIPIKFRARIALTGDVEFEFEPIPRDRQTRFISDRWYDRNSSPAEFSLSGVADDRTELLTDNLFFHALHERTDKGSGPQFHLQGQCSKATIRQPLSAPAPVPVFRVRLRGFKSFGPLTVTCRLGRVTIAGQTEISEPNNMAGLIDIRADEAQSDIDAWCSDADKLSEHVRRVMSFAAGAVLQAPIVEYYHGENLELTAWSQSAQSDIALATIRYLDQTQIFEAAVASFFAPPIAVRKLFFAIEWFAMNSTYNEVRLVGAMTALENLVDSNLDDKDVFILSPSKFDKIRRVLRNIIRGCLAKWSTDAAEDVLSELNEKLADLNRRSLLKKLKTLAAHWSVPLDGISDETMKAAKQARDRIVHRGQYREGQEEAGEDLWHHVTVVREIVVRFIFTAIGFRGRYISHIGGHHDAAFPPQPAASGE
jgi:hypothetical protein